MAIINDDDKSRRLVGTQFDDQINGNGGDDILIGGFGADILNGGSDKDTASYEDSIEGVIVQMGEGGFSGGNGGTAQGDTYISIENVTGSVFDDFVFGDEKNNTIIGGGGTDSLFGGVGDDHLLGSGQQFGGADDDTLESFGAKDALFGGEGNDSMFSDFGTGLLDGGNGFDTVDYGLSNGGVGVFLDGTGVGGAAAGDTYKSIERVIGSDFADTLAGDDLANRLDGGDRGDVLKGFGGADSLFGERGEDTLSGGEGNDVLNGGEDADELIGGNGVDAADYRNSGSLEGISVDLGANVGTGGDALGDTFAGIENVFGTLGADQIIGDALANLLDGDGGNDTLLGGQGNDTLVGQDGADTMIGGSGDDTYVVEGTTDTVSEAFTTGTDTVRSSITFSLSDNTVVSGNVENLILTGSGDTQATGNGLNNVLTGNSGDNRLVGNSGADTMRGGAGDDRYFVENAGDVVDESTTGAGGVDTVQSSVSFSLSGSNALGAIENLALTGSGAANINGAGNGLANEITGTRGNNDLMGLGGNDILTGRSGADTFVFSAALNAATNVDTITDFSVVDDTMRLENAFMTALVTGQLAADAFHIGASAADAEDRIIYDSVNGQLRYDADGSGAGASIQFAQLDTGLLLTSTDFMIV